MKFHYNAFHVVFGVIYTVFVDKFEQVLFVFFFFFIMIGSSASILLAHVGVPLDRQGPKT